MYSYGQRYIEMKRVLSLLFNIVFPRYADIQRVLNPLYWISYIPYVSFSPQSVRSVCTHPFFFRPKQKFSFYEEEEIIEEEADE